MYIEHEVTGEIDELISLFKNSPDKSEKAIIRAGRKLGRWAERQVLRDMSRRMRVPQKILKEWNRVKVSTAKKIGSDSSFLRVWVGINRVGAHRLGKVMQKRRGVQVGRHKFWEGAFVFQPINTNVNLVFEREIEWKHEYQRSKRSGRMMWIGLPIDKKTVSIENYASISLRKLQPELVDRFIDLLHQELNYAFNVES